MSHQLNFLDLLVSIAASLENPTTLKLARSQIPLSRINEVAALRMRDWQKQVRKTPPSDDDSSTVASPVDESLEFELIRLKSLVTWFRSYFNWVKHMECHRCQRPGRITGKVNEKVQDEKVLVEIYFCDRCQTTTKFYRYNNPKILLKTRRGRCDEFAITFAAMCRSLGYRTRYVCDVSDHAWTEVYSYIGKRWIHIDPCEAVVDRPLLYEQGWGKKPTYILAAGIDDIQDVTFRYASDHDGVLRRRNPAYDKQLTRRIIEIRNKLIQRFSATTQKCIMKSVVSELLQSLIAPEPMGSYDTRTSGLRSWSPPNIYFFVPTNHDLCQGSMTIMFSSAADEYRTAHDCFKSWRSHVYHTKNMKRVVDLVHGVSYFTKIMPKEKSFITWGIDIPRHDAFIEEIKIESTMKVRPLMKICWEVKTAYYDVLSSAINACVLEVSLPSEVYKRVFITVSIEGEAGRLFVEQLDSNGASLCVTVSFKTTCHMCQ